MKALDFDLVITEQLFYSSLALVDAHNAGERTTVEMLQRSARAVAASRALIRRSDQALSAWIPIRSPNSSA